MGSESFVSYPKSKEVVLEPKKHLKVRAMSRQLKSRQKHGFFSNRISRGFKSDAYNDSNNFKNSMKRNLSQKLKKRVNNGNQRYAPTSITNLKSKLVLNVT